MFFVPLHLVGLLLRVVHLSPVHLDLLHVQLEICEGLEEAARVCRVSWCGGGGYSKKRKKVDVWRMMVACKKVGTRYTPSVKRWRQTSTPHPGRTGRGPEGPS
jgi:hypothetical protein